VLQIDGKPLDDPRTIFTIAELSGNHGQNYAQAEALVRAAAEAGASACKTQTFDAAEIAADIPFPYGHDAATDVWARGLGVTSFRDLFVHGGLPRAWHLPLKDLATSLGLSFLSTPFSVDAARFLVEEVGVPALKIASGCLTHTPLLEYTASTSVPILLSVGGATVDEIDTALMGPLQEVWVEERLVLLHCKSIYPCPLNAINLRCIATLRERYNVPVGLSDHTIAAVATPCMAMWLKSVVLEKHLRLAADDTSIDVGHSLPPDQFALMVASMRGGHDLWRIDQEEILGDGVIGPHPLEMHDRLFARHDPSDWKRPLLRGREGHWE